MYPLIYQILMKFEVSGHFKKILKHEVLNFMKILPVGAELFRADIRTDVKTLIVASVRGNLS
jgi:hypothetical protein